MKAVVAAFNQEKALVGAFSVITNLWMELFQALACTAVDLPQRLVELVNDDGEVVFPSEGHNTVVAGEGSALREAGEVRVEADVVLDEGLEVVAVLPHVAHHVRPVVQVVIGVAVQLVPQRAEQAVAVPGNLPSKT